MANAISYIKNVGKSVAYTAFDVAKEMTPVFNDFAETNGELVSDMYKSIKNLKRNTKDLPNKIMETKYGKFGKTYLENLTSDLKTGKFYNKERIKKYDDEILGSFGEDIDFNFGGDDDFDFGKMDTFSSDDDISTNEMIDIVGEKTSNAISNTLARSAEYIVEGTAESNKAIYNQMTAIYGGLHSGLATINQNISKMIEFSNEATTTHYENSRTFYTEITRLDQERNAYLKEILDNVKAINGPAQQKKKKSSSSGSTYSDIVTYEGALDFAKYKDVIKKNVKNNSGGIFDMLDVMFEMGMDKELTKSPVSGIMKMMIEGYIPYNIKNSMENLNK